MLEGQGADVLQGGGAQVGGGGGGGHAAVGRAEDQARGGPGGRGARLDQHLGDGGQPSLSLVVLLDSQASHMG